MTVLNIDPESAWAAVETRSERFEGRLYLGVTSTGIYCRPSCPARRPKRENTRFFGSIAEAEAAGFRACLRCRPKEAPRPQALTDGVRALLDGSLEETPTLAALAESLGVSAGHLQRTFKRVTGLTPREYAQAAKRSLIRERLRGGDDVASATYEAGFGSGSRVYERSGALFGMTPGRYRRGGAGVSIGYGIRDCAAGKLLLAASERGICFVAMGDSEPGLEDELRRELPHAAIARDEGAVAEYLTLAAAYFEGREAEAPLDLRGSEFQLQVWKFLRSIPAGRTATYGEVARGIGRPAAVRAVARACASNPVPLFVPCHRVVRGDGGLGGYRWGEERKRALLQSEAGAPSKEQPAG
jgi:AraC family transcriptional regulator of adaptative response/methylated-DNA-[protein]-cysteine methyltransferase